MAPGSVRVLAPVRGQVQASEQVPARAPGRATSLTEQSGWVRRFHNLTLEEQAAEYGDELWNSDPDTCCGLRKVEPMRRALASVDCWVAGVRRGDSSSRSKTPKFAWDKKFNLWKLNPIADWSERDVWNYIREHHLPYNPLHDQGYPSIGCTHCTQPVGPGGSPRDGRWAGVAKTECGIN